MTGLPSPASVSDEAQTFSVRQSSPCGAPRSMGIRGSVGCGQAGPTLVASAGSVQGSGGRGARQRSAPTGGAAYRTPFQALTVPSSTPRTGPYAVSTTGPPAVTGCDPAT